ncbi:MAG: hypothetical protein ACR2HY_01925 [Acidimicrobiales bacterium]
MSQVVAIDRSLLVERVGRVSSAQLERTLNGLNLMLGRE